MVRTTTLAAAIAGAMVLAAPGAGRAAGTDTLFSIGVMTGGDATQYCNFMTPTDAAAFVFDDEATWRFVFVSDYPVAEGSGEEKGPRARAVVNGTLETFVFRGEQTDDKGVLVRRYRGLDDNDLRMVARLKPGEKGMESQNFEGRIIIRRGAWRASVAVKGDCGV
ncbi:hypothetical protein GGD81_003603 [Rhodobium orientis]|uniref:Uncharacterized protein n=1 Tax=Rhodobium orientis TaxID=34017 RepID=A0A327JLK3_9HYPH|nr:hypothetical protein [Rhodobium orientis]MBB4304544.1 hypothetical protein [Rhodobium orientis]MBK5948135.1 hypothetical protein [Rhodobium orientis]RAI26213.1 hypothetical protein CH339_15180 [Rhodobium orientis]